MSPEKQKIPLRETEQRVSPVVEVMRSLLGEAQAVYSYRDDFAALWDENFAPKGTIVVVFDEAPRSAAEQSGLNLADRITAFDWVGWMALRGGTGFSLMLLDLASHRHPGSFGVQTLPLILPELPWVRLYRVFGMSEEERIVSLAAAAKDPASMAARCGGEGYGIDRLLADLQLAGDRPIPLRPAQPDVQAQQVIRELWSQSLTRAHGRHEVANLIGPLILANSMAAKNDAGARDLWVELAKDQPICALQIFLQALRLLIPPADWLRSPELIPMTQGTEHFPAYDMFRRFEKVRFLLVDDQMLLGYAKIVSILLTGTSGPPFEAKSASWEYETGCVAVKAETSPETLLALLEAAASSPENWAKLKTIGRDRFDVLLLDLRLFPESSMERPSEEEVRFLKRLTAIYRSVKTKGDWTQLAFEAARDRLGGMSENPLQWALLPLLLSEADPSLPIVIFSSTHQRDISEALRSLPNVVTSFAKPLITGYQEASVNQARSDLIEAIKRGLQLHEKRAVWEHIVDLDWGRDPTFEIWTSTGIGKASVIENVHYNAKGRPSRHRSPRDSFKPKIAGHDLQIRLATYYREYLLCERYVQSLAAPYELLEEALIPGEILKDLEKGEVKLRLEHVIDRANNPIAAALRSIRNKKSHGHGHVGGKKAWEGWDERARLAATVMLFLFDFIRQEDLAALVVPEPAGLWDEYCLKVVWDMVRKHSQVRSYLVSETFVKQVSANLGLKPDRLTADEVVAWEDATAYTLAVACRDISYAHKVSRRLSWEALEALIANRIGADFVLGRAINWSLDNVEIALPDGSHTFRPTDHYFPQPPVSGELVLISKSEPHKGSDSDWAIGRRCLPHPGRDY